MGSRSSRYPPETVYESTGPCRFCIVSEIENAIFQNLESFRKKKILKWLWRGLVFVWKFLKICLDTLCFFNLLFMIQNTVHLIMTEYIVQSRVVLLLLDFKMQMKMSFMMFEMWLLGFGKVMKSF